MQRSRDLVGFVDVSHFSSKLVIQISQCFEMNEFKKKRDRDKRKGAGKADTNTIGVYKEMTNVLVTTVVSWHGPSFLPPKTFCLAIR